jgi:hypothetical protein
MLTSLLPPVHVRLMVWPGDIVEGAPLKVGATWAAARAFENMLAMAASGNSEYIMLRFVWVSLNSNPNSDMM